MPVINCDIAIVGASLGGVAAALRAGAMGASVYLLEESAWLGGQLTAQGVCTPDENRWIESGGAPAAYLDLRERIRAHYRSRYRLAPSAAARNDLNPGSNWVSYIAVEPKVAHALLAEMLARTPDVTFLPRVRVTEVERRINALTRVVAVDEAGAEIQLQPTFLLDATDTGELLPMAGVEHAVGAEARAETGEPHAEERAHPEWIQPFTFPFMLERRPAGEDHTLPKPPRYDEMKAVQRYRILDGAITGAFTGRAPWWTYRRVIAAENFQDPAFPCDLAMINTGANDYKGGIYPTGDPQEDAATLEAGRLASLGYAYWLQTECPREDGSGRLGYPELRLRADTFDTPDGIAPRPYIRESRRIKALYTVVEQDLTVEHNPGPRARLFSDSCGIGHYWMDVHEGAWQPDGTRPPGYFFETRPFQIPLGSLIPVTVTNLLAACKNLGCTHLTNGAYRLHPIEWNTGEAAGALAAFCLHNRVSPRQAREEPVLLRAYQQGMIDAGNPLFWWADVAAGHPAFRAVQRLSVEGVWPQGEDLAFRPEEPLGASERVQLSASAPELAQGLPAGLSRADAARWLFDRL